MSHAPACGTEKVLCSRPAPCHHEPGMRVAPVGVPAPGDLDAHDHAGGSRRRCGRRARAAIRARRLTREHSMGRLPDRPRCDDRRRRARPAGPHLVVGALPHQAIGRRGLAGGGVAAREHQRVGEPRARSAPDRGRPDSRVPPSADAGRRIHEVDAPHVEVAQLIQRVFVEVPVQHRAAPGKARIDPWRARHSERWAPGWSCGTASRPTPRPRPTSGSASAERGARRPAGARGAQRRETRSTRAARSRAR